MKQRHWFRLIGIGVLALFLTSSEVAAYVKGIYLTQSTAENTQDVNYLLRNAKEHGIDTFVVDMDRPSSRYAKNMALVRQHGIRYVARVVIFPHGGSRYQVRNQKIWAKKLRLAQYAVKQGASAVQLDYIRYNTHSGSSKQHVVDIHNVIKYFRENLKGTKLQIDIFGVAAMKPSYRIGQHVGVFAPNLNAINPMVYPSHYDPSYYHAKRPYTTVYKSVRGLRRQLKDHRHVNVYAYLELSNYHYRMSWAARKQYIKAQIYAALDAGADGFYIWSAKNKYAILFQVLKELEYTPKKYFGQR